MAWLKSASSPLSHGTKLLLQGSLTGAARETFAPMTAKAWKTTQTSNSTSRPYSSQRFARSNSQTPRFKRSGVPPANETPAAAVGESIQGEVGLNKASAQEPTAATGSQTAPPVRKPVDTSSKEYKQAASRYVRFVVGLPVFLVTSYFLWQRLQLQVTVRDSPAATPPSESSSPSS